MRNARAQLKKAWSDAARAAAAKARRGEAPSAPAGNETADQASARANAYIAAHPDDFKPKGEKGKGKGKAKDPQTAKEHAADRAQRQADRATRLKEKAASQAEHAQRAKEHTEDRAQRQADRATRAKEKEASAALKEKHEAEREQDRAARQKQQADRAKQQSAKAGKQTGSTKAKQAKAKAHEAASAVANGEKVTQSQLQSLLDHGLAERTNRGIDLNAVGRQAAQGWARKMAKRARARAWEAEMLSKAELPDLASNAHQSLRKYL